MLNIRQFLYNLVHYGVVVLVVTLAGFVGGYSAPKLLKSPTYSSSSTFVMKMTDKNAKETLGDVLTQNQADTQLLSTYKDILSDSSALDAAVSKLSTRDQDLLASKGGAKVQVNNESNSRLFTISVTSGSGRLSAKIANLMVQDFRRSVKQVTNHNGTVAVMSVAKAGNTTSSQKSKRYAVAGAVAGFALSFMGVLALTLFDPRIHALSDLTDHKLHVVAEIPPFKD